MNKRKKLEDSLAKNLPQKNRVLTADDINNKDIKDDYEFSRATYRDLIYNGTRSIDVMSELARESEHPRAFEVLSNSIKNIADVTDKLMALQTTKKKLNKEQAEANKHITNNNVFVGSTTDLQKMLNSKEENIIDHAKD